MITEIMTIRGTISKIGIIKEEIEIIEVDTRMTIEEKIEDTINKVTKEQVITTDKKVIMQVTVVVDNKIMEIEITIEEMRVKVIAIKDIKELIEDKIMEINSIIINKIIKASKEITEVVIKVETIILLNIRNSQMIKNMRLRNLVLNFKESQHFLKEATKLRIETIIEE